MAKLNVKTGYFQNGLPYVRFGSGSRNLVIFGGLDFDHKPPSGLQLRMATSGFQRLAENFMLYMVSRKPHLPQDYSMKDMADDYAMMIREEFGGPVDVMGISTGGAIAQHFAADHSESVHCLVLAMTGYSLRDEARELQKRVGNLAYQRKWRAAYSTLITGVYPRGIKKYLFKLLMWLFGALGAPADPSDGLIEIEAEDKHNFKERLSEIKMPTLVIGGEEDFFYPVRETASEIPNAKLVLYKGFGHNAMFDNKRQFNEDVLTFLVEHGEQSG